MEKGAIGNRYLIGGENAPFDHFFKIVAEVSGRKFRLFRMPLAVLIAVGYGMAAYTALTGRAPLYLPNDIRRYNHQWGASSQKAISELGYQPRSLQEGLRQTVDWLIAQGRA